ncbi:MAG: hypothetical protein WBL67_10875 [Nitrososphaeraceae archaeon]
MNSDSGLNRCNICSMQMSSLDKIFDHLTSHHHVKEKTTLEGELRLSWNNMTTHQNIPSLLGSWTMDLTE